MARAAGEGTLGGDAIPGDPGAVEAMASRLRRSAAEVASIQQRIASVGLSGSWSGQAAAAFKSSLHELPGELSKLHSSFDGAAGAIGAYAAALSDAQGRANWYARQIEQAESDLSAAQERHASAQSALDSARRSHLAATDPASKASAQRAVDYASGAAARAGAEVDELDGKIASLRTAAHANHEQYEAAASACCSGLDAASHLGIRNSLSSWWNRHITHGFPGEAVAAVAGGVAWVFKEGDDVVEGVEHWTGNTIKDVGKFADDLAHGQLSWEDARAVLEDARAPLVLAGIGLTVAAVVATDGAATPLLIAELSGGVTAVTAADDIAIGAGDSSEALFGETAATREKYRSQLVGDAANLGGDLIDAHGANSALTRAKDDRVFAQKAAQETQKYEATGNSAFKGWATRYTNRISTRGQRLWESLKDEGKKFVIDKGAKEIEHELSPPPCPAPTVPHQIPVPQPAPS